MKIGISCFFLDKGRSGIYRYTIGLLNALQSLDSQNSYEVFVSKDELSLLPLKQKNFVVNPCSNLNKNPVWNIVWHNTVLPILAKRENLDLIYLPTIRRIPS